MVLFVQLQELLYELWVWLAFAFTVPRSYHVSGPTTTVAEVSLGKAVGRSVFWWHDEYLTIWLSWTGAAPALAAILTSISLLPWARVTTGKHDNETGSLERIRTSSDMVNSQVPLPIGPLGNETFSRTVSSLVIYDHCPCCGHRTYPTDYHSSDTPSESCSVCC